MVPARRWMLLAGSLIFYGWSEPLFLWVVLASAILDWGLGFAITKGGTRAKVCVWLGVGSNLGVLLYTKYTHFAVENLNTLLHSAGWADSFPVPVLALPLGVSFIVFEKITYLVDLRRGAVQPAETLHDYLNYVFLFPKLLAGPIVKYHDIATQLARPTHCYEDVRDGLVRFIRGLAKKVLLADSLAPVADRVFALPVARLDCASAWLGLVCFTLQIYFDFSGYSDMAIGISRMLGYRLLENFRDPYLATSFTDFWRRWHISLSTWIKEYLYIPLGGSRVSTLRSYINLCICFLLSGLWHGAAWNFILWGAVHGVMLVIDRAFWLSWSARLPVAFNRVLTFFLIALSWVFFRSTGAQQAWDYFRALFGNHASEFNDIFLEGSTLTVLIVGGLLVVRPLFQRGKQLTPSFLEARPVVALACCVPLLLLCMGRLALNAFHPFLYFRF